MAEQQLHGPQVLRAAVDQGRRGPAQRVGAVVRRVQRDHRHPAVDQPGILPAGQVGRLAHPACERKSLGPELGVRDPGGDRFPGLVGRLELHRLLCLVLEDDGAVRHRAAVGDVADAQRDQVAAAQLAVDRKVEQGEVAQPLRQLQADPDRPDLATFSGGFGPVRLPLFRDGRDERVCSVLLSSDRVCLLSDGRGGRMVDGDLPDCAPHARGEWVQRHHLGSRLLPCSRSSCGLAATGAVGGNRDVHQPRARQDEAVH